MAYDSTALALHSGQIGRSHSTAGVHLGGNVWHYRSADPLATISASSYFSDGFKRGMRKYDSVLAIDTGTTLPFTIMVTSVSTASGGATAGGVASSST